LSIYEDVTPNPEFLIKAIAEQGYSLEAALADLIDNSISANADKVEILTKIDEEPFVLYLADNGTGMNEDTLKQAMHFPSNSPEADRTPNDLGRFGLGMKTASFSQTRKFTVISRLDGNEHYSARTWDVGIQNKHQWKVIVSTDEEIEEILSSYNLLSNGNFQGFDNFEPNTIIVWHGLFKFEQYLEEKNRQKAFAKEITEITTEHLSLVFHRYMERKNQPLNIRVNNVRLESFNPFPIDEDGFRRIEMRQKQFNNDSIKMEGFILPARSLDETKQGDTKWTTKRRSLSDMEGIYIYRADRIILFGGWNGIIRKMPKLQLARLRVDIGNKVDHLLHLNVAKSQVIVPHELKKAFEDYIDELKSEAEKEFNNRGIRRFAQPAIENKDLFVKRASNRGALLEINPKFPVLEVLKDELTEGQNAKLNVLLKMINTQMNKIRGTFEEESFINVSEQDPTQTDITEIINSLTGSGISKKTILTEIVPQMGYKFESLPLEVKELLDA
jgi:hypothetical protein